MIGGYMLWWLIHIALYLLQLNSWAVSLHSDRCNITLAVIDIKPCYALFEVAPLRLGGEFSYQLD